MPLESTRHRSVTLSSSSGNGPGSGVGLGSSGCGWLVRGQYEGYRGEEGVGPVSTTDTFAMAVLGMRGDNKGEGKGEGLNIGDERSSDDSGNANTNDTDGDYEYNNDDQDGGLDGDVDGLCGRWCGVPMVLVAGKGMHKKQASVRIEYRTNTPSTTNQASSSSSNVLDEVLDVMKEVNTELARLQALRGKVNPTTTSSLAPGINNDGDAIVDVGDERVCIGLALVLQIQPQPGLYIERQLKVTTAATVVTEREVLLSLTDLLSCPVHDPLGQALQLWPSPLPTTSGPSPVPVPTEAYTRILQALLTSPPRPSHRDDTSSPGPSPRPSPGTAHDRLFVSLEEVALQWSLFDQALAHDATDPADIARDTAAVDDKNQVKDVTDMLIKYAVGSDVETVLRGSGVGGVDGLLLDTDPRYDNAADGSSDAKVVPPVITEIGSKRPGGNA